jgi:SAM-dependent methyltransferase
MLMSVTELAPLLRMLPEVPAKDIAGPDRAVSRDDGLPVLVDFDRSVLVREQVFANGASSPIRRPRAAAVRGRIKQMLSPPKRITHDNLNRFLKLLRDEKARPHVLVIGGGTVGQGMEPLYEAEDIAVVAFDIYASPIIHFVADAHDIPLLDQSVDGVIVQAVLEHVLDPAQVVAEIWRVLKPDGLVYAETPFLQHVHEGAYDFTRFTESGHRYLFRRFDLITSGVCGGPGTQLLWSIDYFVRGLFRSWTVGKLAKFAFFWLPWFDRLIPDDFGSDAASGFYFLGRRSAATLSPHGAVSFYRGAQRTV